MYSLVCRYHAGILLVTAVVVYVGILAITVNVVAMPTHAIANFGSLGGGILETPCLSICPSICMSACPFLRTISYAPLNLFGMVAHHLVPE